MSVDSENSNSFEPNALELKGRAAGGAVATLASQSVRLIAGIGTTIVVARILVPEDFGLVAMITIIMSLGQTLLGCGLSAAMVQKAQIDHQGFSNIFWISLGTGICLTLTFMVLSVIAAHWLYRDERVIPVGLVASAGLLLAGMTITPQAILRRRMAFGLLSIIEITSAIVLATTTIFLAFAWRSHWALVIGPLASAMTILFVTFSFAKWSPSWPKWNRESTEMMKFGMKVNGYSLLNYCCRNADNLIIGSALGPHSLGLYSRSYGIMLLPIHQVSGPISGVVVPLLSRLAHDPVAYRRAYFRVVETMLLVTIPLGIFVWFAARPLVAVILGPGWSDAGPIVAILAINSITQPIAASTGWLFTSQGRAGDLFRWGVISAPMIVATFFIGLPFGIQGIAFSYTMGVTFVMIPLLFWVVGRKGAVAMQDFYKILSQFIPLALFLSFAMLVTRSALRDATAVTILSVMGIVNILCALAFVLLTSVGQTSFRLAVFAVTAFRNRNGIVRSYAVKQT